MHRSHEPGQWRYSCGAQSDDASCAEDSTITTTTRVLGVPRFARHCQIVDNLTLHLNGHINRRRKPRRLTVKSMWATANLITCSPLFPSPLGSLIKPLWEPCATDMILKRQNLRRLAGVSKAAFWFPQMHCTIMQSITEWPSSRSVPLRC